jgi:thioredoxin reductase
VGPVTERPFPPGDYEVVVVGSGPGGLQTAYGLAALGVETAVISADDAPSGMFRKWPIFQRLISWTTLAAADPDEPEYERYDHNSLVGDAPEVRSLVARAMGRESIFPSRAEMEEGLAAFAERGGVRVRYGCRWERTRREGDGRLVLETSDGEYRCRAAIFAIGVTEPWKAAIPGVETVPHYAETGEPRDYEGKRVVIIGKRNSGFEVAAALLPWARQILLVSPQPVRTSVLAHATVRARYLQPLEVHGVGGGTFVLDAMIDRIERSAQGGVRVHTSGTTYPGPLTLEADAAVVATGFQTPLRDLVALGVETVSHGRIPALTPYWESMSTPSVYFAGNASQGAPELRKHGFSSGSTTVRGFRYSARVLARHVAERLGRAPVRPLLRPDDAAPALAGELARGPELWAQKGYLARVLTLDSGTGIRDDGVVPLAHFVDEAGPDAVAVCLETGRGGEIYPCVYARQSGRLREEPLDPHPLNAFDGEEYIRRLDSLVRG